MIAIKRPGSKLHQQRLVSNNIISSFSLTGGIAKKVEEAAVISTLGIDVTIALAGGKAGRGCHRGGGWRARHPGAAAAAGELPWAAW